MTTKASRKLLIEIVVDPGCLTGNYFVNSSRFESANVRVMIDEKLTRSNIFKSIWHLLSKENPAVNKYL